MVTYPSLSFTKLFSTGSSASPKDSYIPTISPSIVATDPLIYGAGVV
jgi:hypothetical protein